MFVLGLALGPFLGLIIAAAMHRVDVLGSKARAVVCAFILVAVLLVPSADVGLRVGLAAGLLLGFLLSATPLTTSTDLLQEREEVAS